MTPPLPPADLATRSPETLILDEGALIERIFAVGFDPIHFDRSNGGRLNAPDTSYGVLYAASEIRGAFTETFLREPGHTLLPTDMVEKRGRVLRVARASGSSSLWAPGWRVLGPRPK